MRYYGTQNEVKAYLNRLQKETTIQVTPSTVKTLNDRVEALKKSGVWSQYSLGFNDADADGYFQRATVNDVMGRSEVCWFVRGMKALGLWQNMVSWPLRSYQNAGTGSTVYSLGGLGIYNGTMVNSPTWGINGIECNLTNQAINATTLPLLNNAQFSLFFTAKTTTYQKAIGWNFSTRIEWQNGNRFFINTRSGTSNNANEIINTDVSNFRSVIAAGSVPDNTVYIKTDTLTGNIVTGLAGSGNFTSTSTFGFGGSEQPDPLNPRTFAFGGFSTDYINPTRSIIVNSLYKQTMGHGLALP